MKKTPHVSMRRFLREYEKKESNQFFFYYNTFRGIRIAFLVKFS